ncbi:MAG: hypothetical protein RQ866_03505 [Bacteroidales bacterium]|nr:hypothetical protein [Bacteroidales bacterium]
MVKLKLTYGKKFIWPLVVLTVIILLIISLSKHNQSICKGVDIEIVDNTGTNFLNENDIMGYLIAASYKPEGAPLRSIEITDIKKHLVANPYIAIADVFVTIEGILKVRVKQRQPLVKVYNQNNEDYYICKDGYIMPGHTPYKDKIMIANGNFREPLSSIINKNIKTDSLLKESMLTSLFNLADFIQKDSLLHELISQIYLNNDKDFEMIPAIDDHVIVFGNSDSIAYKFKKIIAFYEKGSVITGWKKYNSINVKFSNQVVCTKKK